MRDFPEEIHPSHDDCYDFFYDLIHPKGLSCPNDHHLTNAAVHRSYRQPIIDYRCKICGSYFNIFTGTPLQGSKLSITKLYQCFEGMMNKTPHQKLAKQIGISRKAVSSNCKKMGGFYNKRKNQEILSIEVQKKETDWKPFLRRIEWWSEAEGHLKLKMENGGVYKLFKNTYTSIKHRGNIEKRRIKKITSVEKIHPVTGDRID